MIAPLHQSCWSTNHSLQIHEMFIFALSNLCNIISLQQGLSFIIRIISKIPPLKHRVTVFKREGASVVRQRSTVTMPPVWRLVENRHNVQWHQDSLCWLRERSCVIAVCECGWCAGLQHRSADRHEARVPRGACRETEGSRVHLCGSIKRL